MMLLVITVISLVVSVKAQGQDVFDDKINGSQVVPVEGLVKNGGGENDSNNINDDPILEHPNLSLINQGDCGKNEYIFGYEEEKKPIIQQYLWMVALRHPFQNHQYVPCNGVLINKNYILTSDCVDWNDEVSVTLGDFHTGGVHDCYPRNDDPDFCLDPVQTTTVAEFFMKDRLVLARLSIPAVIGRRDHIQAICLPVSPEQRSRVYQKYTLTGWKESGKDFMLLQRAVVDLIQQKACLDEMANVLYASEEEKNITDGIVCVRNLADPNRSPRCEDYQQGSAIQAVEKKSNRYLLYGIQTGISYCSKPERFIAVTEYLAWILDHMKP